jgi:hypothetical protein
VELGRKGIKGTTKMLPRVKGAFTLMITATFLVYLFMLSRTDFSMMSVSFNVANVVLHYVVPVMVILDWLLFDKKRSYRWSDPFMWAVIPLLYLQFVFIRAEVGGVLTARGSRYPYFFLDIDAIGISAVLIYVLIFMVAFIVMGYVYVLVDRLLLKKRNKDRQAAVQEAQ